MVHKDLSFPRYFLLNAPQDDSNMGRLYHIVSDRLQSGSLKRTMNHNDFIAWLIWKNYAHINEVEQFIPGYNNWYNSRKDLWTIKELVKYCKEHNVIIKDIPNDILKQNRIVQRINSIMTTN